ncbi:MAG TPA: MFS transporter [Stellaceae bacterium]|nr:MFS transporter [Stellaceae bacterium]
MLGVTQWLAWGSTYYLVTILAQPITADTGWPLASVVAGLSIGLIIAGLVSPLVGKAIERHNGRPVLAFGAMALALGLIALGLAQDQAAYFLAWAVLGIGMGASLYDAAFAALGKLYGLRARPMIGKLTLIGGLVMTVTWPLSAALVASIGWRGTCFFYAGMHLAVGLPLLLFLLPTAPPDATAPTDVATRMPTHERGTQRRRRLLVWLVGTNLTLQIGIGSVLAVHLMSLLQGLGLDMAMAVALGSLMGACQVAGRLIEIAVARHLHPVWEGVAASVLVFVGFALLLGGDSMLIGVALVIYGLGNGVRTIVKGTLPLVLFGAEGYATLVGRLGMPTLIAQAAGPALGALVLSRYGVAPTLAMLAGLALVNLALSYALRIALPRRAPAARDLSAVPG